MHTIAIERLKNILVCPEEELDLAEAALLVAQDEYPALDVSAYLHRLDQFASHIKARLKPEAGCEDIVVALNEFLFDEQGFSGNTDNYYDPRNSFLNEVLDRKLGIPLTLCLIYIEVGRRVGLALEGVSFPGHFLVKFATQEGYVVLDPFSGGIPISEEDLVERLTERFGEENAQAAPLAQLLVSAGKKEILLRMLRNLKAIYLHNQDLNRTLTVMNRILLVAPDLADEVRDRAQLYERLECFRPALEDYRRYLKLNPETDELPDMRRRVIELERLAARLN